MSRKPSSGRRGSITENWFFKLLSLVIAIFLWYLVVGEKKIDMNVTVPVEIVNLPHDLIISNQFKKQLEVTVSGSRGIIRNLALRNITRTIDLSKAKPGTMVIRNEPEIINFPSGIKVTRIQPPHIILLLDEVVQKEFVLKPLIIGEPAEGYELASADPVPSVLDLTGPKSILGNGPFIHTVPFDITGMDHSEDKQVSLDLDPAMAELIGEPIIMVRVRIKERRLVKVVSKIPIEIKGKREDYNYFLHPATISVEAEFPYTAFKDSEKLQELFKAQIDVTDLDSGVHETGVLAVTLLEGVRLISVSPEALSVEISRVLGPLKQKLRLKPSGNGAAAENKNNGVNSDETTVWD